MSLEPSQILDVETPRLALQLLCRKVPEPAFISQDQKEIREWLTADKCREDSKTPRREFPGPAVQKFLVFAAEDVASEDNRQASRKGFEAHNTWASLYPVVEE